MVALDGPALRDAFYRKIQDERELLYDINLYERMDESLRTYPHLMGRVTSAIRMQDQKRNLQERGSQLAGRPSRSVNANPAINDVSSSELSSKAKMKAAAALASPSTTNAAPEAAAPAFQPKGKGKADRAPSQGARDREKGVVRVETRA